MPTEAKKGLILFPSNQMDNNKKPDRNEHSLIRMSKAAREYMGFKSTVEVFNQSDSVPVGKVLEVFQAFRDDLAKAKAAGLTREELLRVGFVTTATFKRVTGSSSGLSKNMWITDDVGDTVLGADPEFLLFDSDGKVIKANNVISKAGPIGSDGAMAEIRPKPAKTPEMLVQNMLSILRNEDLTERIAKYNWLAGCYYFDTHRDYPIGGHIHIGNPVKMAAISSERRFECFRTLNKILDELVALPMIKADGTELGRKRRTQCQVTGNSNSGFGFFGEWRHCDGRLEHRTLSGMWLMHPKFAELVIGVTKAVVDEMYVLISENNFNTDYMFPSKFREDLSSKDYAGKNIWKPTFDGWKEIGLAKDMQCTTSSKQMCEILNGSLVGKITAKFLRDWHSKLRNMSTYPRYSYYIDGLYEVLKNKIATFQNFDKKLQKNWLEGASFID